MSTVTRYNTKENLQTQHGSPSSLTPEVCLPLLTASMASLSSAYTYILRIYNSSKVTKKHYPGREAAAVGNVYLSVGKH
ncbi:hypothetical protein QQP08_013966 [Theobroma cacao]|nr:hypothetical protein QQP08_013966 [Theobroma cacao]